MAAKHIGLGRGLGALIKDGSAGETPPVAPAERANKIPVAMIRKSPWQPRRVFSPEPLAELIESVKERGVLQPLLVRKVADHFELIAGERRLRAAQEAALTEVPAVIMDVGDQEALEIALVENLQRSDLNLVEEAEGYRMLAEKFSLTQEQIAERVGKARPTIANALRLLDLPDPVKQLVAERRITPGHAKALLGLEIPREQELLAERVIAEDMSVRTLERIVARTRRAPKKPRAETQDIPTRHLESLTEQLQHHFGTQVRLSGCKTLSSGKKIPGRLEIDYYSSEELDRIIQALGLGDTF
ncbi:MAG TPA: ParB/RepB/Spo0J family partition protein [Kiritimatiellia bacterium]|nr:ParB/RepB/Spo0J family partition protein [Kiritimatiellia bacterium]HMP00432.1 ParB/RepB/Spo0J family partition protein [Kiritimatiellia bacterium]HMP97339.1 ParB/RepB/Spo0J family partition protein [Kiritimatiellia bacterium]